MTTKRSDGSGTGLDLLLDYDSTSSDDQECVSELSQLKKECSGKAGNEEGKCGLGDRLPLPNALKNMFKDQDKNLPDDCPSRHEFRKRSFPHVRGNWATIVYASFPVEDFRPLQQRMTEILLDTPDVEFLSIDDPHLSVSKVVTLQYSWIQPFLSSLRVGFQKEIKGKFSIGWHKIQAFVNEEATRTFISLCTNLQGENELENAVLVTNRTLDEYSLPTFYDPPLFHVSLLWALGDQRVVAAQCSAALNESLKQCLAESALPGVCEINAFKCKVGCKVFKFDL